MNVIISGINGRMGNYVYQILKNSSDFVVVGGIDVFNKDKFIYRDFDELIKEKAVDLLIDFSSEELFCPLIKKCLENQIKVISGTTGVKKELILELKKIALENKTSFIWVPNYASGASIMYDIMRNNVNKFKNFDIIESHNLKKVDKPSGTAKEYADLLCLDYDVIQVLRLNEVIAAHEIILNNPGERLIIRHEIKERDAFLKGFMLCLMRIKACDLFIVNGLEDFYDFLTNHAQ